MILREKLASDEIIARRPVRRNDPSHRSRESPSRSAARVDGRSAGCAPHHLDRRTSEHRGTPPCSRRAWFIAYLFPLLLLLVGGCATSPVDAPSAVTPTQAAYRETFHLGGRLLAEDGQQRFATSFFWDHAPKRSTLTLLSPTGQTLAILTLEASLATLRTPDGERQEADAAALLEPLLGFAPPPLPALTAWIQGRPGPMPDRIERDPRGRLQRVWHSGWIVTFDSWQDDRPRRLTIERGAARLVLLLDTWSSEP